MSFGRILAQGRAVFSSRARANELQSAARRLGGKGFVLGGPLWLVGTAALLMTSSCRPPADPISHGQALYDNCVACHSKDGSGNVSIKAPAIAGMNRWYLKRQLVKFRDGVRGAHPEDQAGLKMRPMARTLFSDENINAVADYVATLPPVQPAATLEGGNAERGKMFYATCAACHGPDAKGLKALNGPSLVNTQDWYLATQLDHFKRRVRGGEPRDIEGGTMAPMALTLPDEQAVKDVIAYIYSLRK